MIIRTQRQSPLKVDYTDQIRYFQMLDFRQQYCNLILKSDTLLILIPTYGNYAIPKIIVILLEYSRMALIVVIRCNPRSFRISGIIEKHIFRTYLGYYTLTCLFHNSPPEIPLFGKRAHPMILIF